MTPKQYKKECLRTENVDLFNENISYGGIRLLHAALGMVTEASEFADILKKGLFYGREIDLVHAKKELGDILWYIAIACDVFETSFEELFDINITKLRNRYPDKFTAERANNRAEGDI